VLGVLLSTSLTKVNFQILISSKNFIAFVHCCSNNKDQLDSLKIRNICSTMDSGIKLFVFSRTPTIQIIWDWGRFG
jgi:hypothetical protein